MHPDAFSGALMMITRTLPVAALLCALALPATANDGFGGLAATGLTFSETEAVAMEEEDLFIGLDRIAVDYVFRNLTDADVTGEVIFPLPPVSIGAIMESDWNLPEDRDRPNLVNFTALVDDKEVAVTIDRIAVIAPPWEDGRPLSEQYDTPGRDVTADLSRLGLPLSMNGETVSAALQKMDDSARAEATALGLAEFFDDGTGGSYVYPAWSVILRYHWTQTFPAGQVVKISHTYENRSSGGLFGWSDPPEDYMASQVAQYCIDAGTSKAIEASLAVTGDDGSKYSMGMAWNIAYVLRTANSWAGPIGKFRLTIDKGDTANILSLCADGIRKTGPTTFVMEKTNYVPDRDLEILVTRPMDR
jgi:hypothetical protein